MGVYIGMEMPKNGSCIQIVIDDDGKVYPSVEKCILKMGSIAKAVPVPPHGRLGDLDKLENGMRHMAKYQYGERQQCILGCCETIRSEPTIIPASEEGE